MMSVLAGLLAAVFLVTGCADHSYWRKKGWVHFRLKDGQAREVVFSSSQEGFAFQQAHKTGKSTWEVNVPDRGEFSYFYIVDGKIYRPDCRYRETDDFGSYNCLYKPDP